MIVKKDLVQALTELKAAGEPLTVQAVAGFPTVDAVKVVRCPDCKWYKENKTWGPQCGKTYKLVRNDDFCSRAERKESE